ncbi:MAG TPA: hypothetical protein VMZ29_12090 [Candidatus Bathyarchaeia archaeon]|nr:hypothetical protein [Candidatus Bathyarchaeia archaeon]
MTPSDSIPLYLMLDEPLAFYMLSDTLIGYKTYGSNEHQPYQSFVLLRELVKAQPNSLFVPDSLKKYFTSPLSSNFTYPDIWHYIIGTEIYQGNIFTLNFSLNLSALPHLVYFKDFSYMNNPFDLTLQFSPSEAFFLLANICANSQASIHWSFYYQNQLLPFPSHTARQLLRNTCINNLIGPSIVFVNLFIYDYMVYLYDQLLSGTLSPYDLLRNNGSLILAFFGDLPPVTTFLRSIMIDLKENPALTFNQ